MLTHQRTGLLRSSTYASQCSSPSNLKSLSQLILCGSKSPITSNSRVIRYLCFCACWYTAAITLRKRVILNEYRMSERYCQSSTCYLLERLIFFYCQSLAKLITALLTFFRVRDRLLAKITTPQHIYQHTNYGTSEDLRRYYWVVSRELFSTR